MKSVQNNIVLRSFLIILVTAKLGKTVGFCEGSATVSLTLISKSVTFEGAPSPGMYLSDSFVDHLKFDVIIWYKEENKIICKDLLVNWIQGTFSSATISILPVNQSDHSDSGSSESNRALFPQVKGGDRNQKALIQIFVGFNEVELVNLATKVHHKSDNENGSSTTLRFNNVYFFVHPEIFQSKSQVKQTASTLMTSIGQHLTPMSNVYVLFYYYQKNDRLSNMRSSSLMVSLLVHEAYSIRNKTIVHEMELHPKINISISKKKKDTAIPIPDRIERVPLTHKVFHNFLGRRMNWEGATVIGAGLEDADYPFSTWFKENSTEFGGGFDVGVYRYLRDALNFSEKAVKCVGDTEYINLGPNGTLTGYAQVLKRGAADIGTGAAESIPYRLKGPDAISLLHPTSRTKIKAYFKQPPSRTVRNIYTKTFSTPLWLSMAGIWVSILISLRMIVYIEQKLRISNENDKTISEDSMIWATGAVCQQGWYTCPGSLCVKIVFFLGSATGLILYIAYSAPLVSILSINAVPIKKFGDLTLHDYTIVNDGKIPTADLILRALEEAHEIRPISFNRNIAIDDNFQSLIQTKLAIVSTDHSFYPVLIAHNFTDRFICTTIEHTIVTTHIIKMGPFVMKGSPLRPFFNYVIIKMAERGVLTRLHKNYLRDTSVKCLTNRDVGHEELEFGDVFTAFVILAYGYVISTLIILMEKVYLIMHVKK